MSFEVAIKVEKLSKCYQIYDTPRDLGEFKPVCRVDAGCCACLHYDYAKMDCGEKVISRPPQSWCYVEDVQAK